MQRLPPILTQKQLDAGLSLVEEGSLLVIYDGKKEVRCFGYKPVPIERIRYFADKYLEELKEGVEKR